MQNDQLSTVKIYRRSAKSFQPKASISGEWYPDGSQIVVGYREHFWMVKNVPERFKILTLKNTVNILKIQTD